VSKTDISTTTLPPWDTYKNKQPDEALGSIYTDIQATSLQMRNWYWTSIRSKRKTSLAVRGATVVLLIFGTILPIFAAIQVEAKDKLGGFVTGDRGPHASGRQDFWMVQRLDARTTHLARTCRYCFARDNPASRQVVFESRQSENTHDRWRSQSPALDLRRLARPVRFDPTLF
jgi:hypothetical protein